MTIGEKLDATILALLLVWFVMDRFNIYLRKTP
jgi:hypothetical protein